MKDSKFRNWLRIIWQENCHEHEAHNELPFTLPEYWAKYRWWLRREYRHQTRTTVVRYEYIADSEGGELD